jgi:hypothetical protein
MRIGKRAAGDGWLEPSFASFPARYKYLNPSLLHMDPLSWQHWIYAAKLGPAPQKARTRYPSSLLAASHSTGNSEEREPIA